MRGSLLVFVLLLSLPALTLLGVGAYLGCTMVPSLIRYEPVRIGLAYRQQAEALRDDPTRATYVGPRKRGWRQTGKIDGLPWGHADGPSQVEIWCRTGAREWHAMQVPRLFPVNYAGLCYGWGALLALLVLLADVMAIRAFVRFHHARDDFMAATAHDLATPLVGLRLAIGRDDELARILNERLIRLVTNVKDFLRLGHARAPDCGVVDVVAAFEEAYRLFRDDYRELQDGHDLLAPDTPPVVKARADEANLVQIFWNLLSNNLKYAAPYGRISVRIMRVGNHVEAVFADRGPGMTPRQMRHAFDRYYRAKSVRASGKGGFGIGLCTARDLARAMGGDLTVRANHPVGCLFTLSLPAENMV